MTIEIFKRTKIADYERVGRINVFTLFLVVTRVRGGLVDDLDAFRTILGCIENFGSDMV